MLKEAIESIYFLLPAAAATLTPQMVAHYRWWEFLNIPIDGRKTVGGRRIFGDNKTVRGYIVGVVSALLVGGIQYFLYFTDYGQTISLFPYQGILNTAALSLLLGLGALVGDSIKSFFKRQLEIPAGSSWIFFDQIDFVLGAIFFSLPVIVVSINYYAWMIGLYMVIHVLTTSIGYMLGIKKKWI